MLEREKYINPFTDFGFKKLFGEEANADLLIDFLNALLFENAAQIVELTFLKNEQLGATPVDRRAVFDLYCQNERGEKFIVELQKAKQKFFKDRSLYYATFAVQEQARVGEWDFQLNAVYSVSIMDFVFDEESEHEDKFRHDVQLVETATNRVFYSKLRFVYLEMPKFNKSEDELESNSDKWLYVLKNLARLQDVPPKVQERIFLKMFQAAEIAQYNPQERQAYQDSIKYYRDLKNVIDTANTEGREEGRQIGIEEGRQEGQYEKAVEVAKQLKQIGMQTTQIALITKLSEDEINELS